MKIFVPPPPPPEHDQTTDGRSADLTRGREARGGAARTWTGNVLSLCVSCP